MASMEHIISQLIDNIGNKYNIDKEELVKLVPNIIEKKKKKLTPCSNQHQCMGRKQDGKQCTRRKKEGADYCGKHINCQKYGRIDDKSADKLNDDLLRTVLVDINNSNYLMDINNNLFSFHPEAPEYIGKYIDNQIVYCN